MPEQQPYAVIERHSGVELRRYPAHVVAEVTVRGTFQHAGNDGFRHLIRYLKGHNQSATSVAMTAPVVQQPSSGAGTAGSGGRPSAEKIAMTAPVVQHATGEGTYALGFVLPASLTIDSAPVPLDPAVRLRQVPERLSAARRYSGRWTEASYARHLAELHAAIQDLGLVPVGEPRFTRFNPPSWPSFLRRNEAVQDVRRAEPA